MIRCVYLSIAVLLTCLLAPTGVTTAEAAPAGAGSDLQIDWAQYDGQRVKGSNSVWVYLILHGRLHLIPDATTYSNLFTNWNGISVNNYLVNNVPWGPALSSGAILTKGSEDWVYLVSDGKRLLIPDAATFNTFYFAWNKIVTVPDVILESIPTGVQIY